MFADSMLETSWAQRSRRNWTTLTSFGVQGLVVGFLLLLPLVRPVGLPFLKPLPTPVMLAVPAGPPPTAQAHPSPRPADSNMANGKIIMPPSIPRGIRVFEEPEVAAPQIGQTGPYVPERCNPYGGTGWVPYAVGNSTTPLPMPPPPTAKSRPLRVSEMREGDLVRKVQPIYPPLARSARIQGTVVLVAVISKEGAVENLRVVEGHPMLVAAAIDAVRQWRYRPYILNREPIEVETQITVKFSLSGN